MTREVMAPTPTMNAAILELRRAQLRALGFEKIQARYAERTGITDSILPTAWMIDFLVWEEPPIAFTGADGDLVE